MIIPQTAIGREIEDQSNNSQFLDNTNQTIETNHLLLDM